jgi:fucose permease
MDFTQEEVIKPDSYRYVNWILFVLAAFANSIPTQAFSGVSPTISKVYEITQLEATIPSLIYPISYVFLLIPANYILDKKGLKLGTLICTFSKI